MKSSLPVLLLLFFFSCTNDAKIKPARDTAATTEDSSITEIEGPEPADKSQFYIWNVNSEQKTKTLNPQIRQEFYNVDTLLLGLNEKYPKILLEKKSIGHDTLYTEIKDARYLAEQMGSTGAEQYVAQAVVNLTSVKGINYLRIDFEEGSHASPDVWSKEAFRDYKEVK